MDLDNPRAWFVIGVLIGGLPPLTFWLYYLRKGLTHTLADIALALVKVLGLPVALFCGLVGGLAGLAIGHARQRGGSNGWLFGAALAGIAVFTILRAFLLGRSGENR